MSDQAKSGCYIWMAWRASSFMERATIFARSVRLQPPNALHHLVLAPCPLSASCYTLPDCVSGFICFSCTVLHCRLCRARDINASKLQSLSTQKQADDALAVAVAKSMSVLLSLLPTGVAP